MPGQPSRPTVRAFVVIALLGALASCAVPPPSAEERDRLRVDGVAATILDIAYGADPAQVADVYLPTKGGNRGVIVAVHGGAFAGGHREMVDDWFGPVLRQTRRGFAVVRISYRLVENGVGAFPAGVEDASLAIDWVRREGAALGLNPATMIIAGHSAGGTIAALVGTGGNSPVSAPLGRTAKVDGWLSIAGIYEFERAPAAVVGLGATWLAHNSSRTPWVRAASVTRHLDRKDPPGYLVHGDLDGAVPVSQAHELLSAASRAGISLRLHYDIVSAGPASCRNHLPQCGMNAPALDRWIDQIVTRSL